MQLLKSFWVPGFMPIELLGLLSLAFFLFVFGNYLLKRIGTGIPPFGQTVLIWLTTFSILKYALHPPIPSSLLFTYMGLITIVIFLLISSTEASWRAFKRPIVATITAQTYTYRIVRAVIFVVLPVLAWNGTYNFVVPKTEEPVELRFAHPTPPQSIIVYPPSHFQQTHLPFRVGG